MGRGRIHFPRRILFSGSHSGSVPEITPEEAERLSAKGSYLIWGYFALSFCIFGVCGVLSAFSDRADRVTDDFTSGALFFMIAYGIYYKKLRILREKIRPKQ